MSRRQTPIDKMRELADDGLEPWQIAAALGVREQTVLVALEAREPAGGAQRAVEDAASLAPTKPDTLAPTRPVRGELTVPAATTDAHLEQIRSLVDDDVAVARALPAGTMRTALVEHVAVTVCGPDDVDETGGEACDVCGRANDATGDEPWCDRCRTVMGAIAAGAPPLLAVEAAASVALDRDPDYGTHSLAEASAPEQIHKPNQYPCATGQRCRCLAAHRAVCPGLIQANEPSAHEVPSDVTPSGHVHDPFPVADEAGVWHAECECGTRWDRASCDICGVPVAAIHIARTGLRRHAHHRTA